MKCPCCENELTDITSFTAVDSLLLHRRHYNYYICTKGNNVCAGLSVKEDVLEAKVTYVTPAHTAVTLHKNYIENVTPEDLRKTIFTTFEYLAIQDLKGN